MKEYVKLIKAFMLMPNINKWYLVTTNMDDFAIILIMGLLTKAQGMELSIRVLSGFMIIRELASLAVPLMNKITISKGMLMIAVMSIPLGVVCACHGIIPQHVWVISIILLPIMTIPVMVDVENKFTSSIEKEHLKVFLDSRHMLRTITTLASAGVAVVFAGNVWLPIVSGILMIVSAVMVLSIRKRC